MKGEKWCCGFELMVDEGMCLWICPGYILGCIMVGATLRYSMFLPLPSMYTTQVLEYHLFFLIL
jgi:hypothetical protein